MSTGPENPEIVLILEGGPEALIKYGNFALGSGIFLLVPCVMIEMTSGHLLAQR